MANPDVAMAFQNPRVQQAIMEVCRNWLIIFFFFKSRNYLSNILSVLQCSQNPLNITKYQNDKEVYPISSDLRHPPPIIENCLSL